MKSLSVVFLSILFLFGNLAAEVIVTFENPDEFTDIDYDYRGNKRGQKVYLPQIEKYIVRTGQKYLEEGEVLRITFTDIDLAGMHEPWRAPPMDDVRIVKSIYPPRMSFSYELTDAEGTVIKSGEERLVDISFDFRMRTSTWDELYYDKEMFRDWLRTFKKQTDK